ncbi:DUF4349 domain-containing protein [Anoxynatronum sibiricum]|uniref:DUF4349 domain-containing protein n=1 Tax=Anoxynatronum sibiricum TaxID=210623 RepID=A0ABU9VPC1_9CLOT
MSTRIKNGLWQRNRYVVLILLLIMLVFGMAGCSRSPEYAASDSGWDDGAVTESRSPDAMPAAEAPAEASGGGVDLSTVNQSQHKIIYSGEVSMETLDFDDAVAEIQAYVSRLGGYAESSYVEGRRIGQTTNTSRRNASFTFRIPQQRFDGFTEGLKEFGNVLSASSHGENITEQYFDTEARLTSLLIQEERMLGLLERAENMEDILRIESELTHLRYQIESFTGSLQKWDNLVQFATMRVNLREVSEMTPDPDSRHWGTEISEAFKESVVAVIRTLQNLVVVLIMFIPVAIVLLPLFFLARFVYRLIRKKISQHKKDPS